MRVHALARAGAPGYFLPEDAPFFCDFCLLVFAVFFGLLSPMACFLLHVDT